MKILLVDNYDSYTYNLAQMLRESGLCTYDVVPNDQIDIQGAMIYDKILISPGPGLPFEAGLTNELIKTYSTLKSILGICLGHQAIAETFGAQLYRMSEVRHGQVVKTSITAADDPIFMGIPAHIDATLYHSWAVSPDGLPDILMVLARSADGQIMAVRHRTFDVWGLQFHPESVGTEYGQRIIENWLRVGGEQM